MELKVLGSSSKGNCYFLQNENETLIIECGVPVFDIKKELDFDFLKVKGCIISHEHGDHASSVRDLQKLGIDVFASNGTLKVLKVKGKKLKHLQMTKIGNFKIMPFNVSHDAEEPFGFVIFHKEIGQLLFLTDTSDFQYDFKNINHYLIEANYSRKILETNVRNGKLNEFIANRVLNSHLSFEKTKEILLNSDLSKAFNIVLIHLSDINSTANSFKKEINALTNKNTFIAERGLNIALNNDIF